MLERLENGSSFREKFGTLLVTLASVRHPCICNIVFLFCFFSPWLRLEGVVSALFHPAPITTGYLAFLTSVLLLN